MKRVLLGMSGGVDSSVAAALLLNQGYAVEGATFLLWDGQKPGTVADARAVCETLGIKHHVLDYTESFKNDVLGYFIDDYLAGRTPNPCVICNRELKFGFLIDRAHDAGLEFDFFATGHYARKEVRHGISFVRTAVDSAKDQTYFLYGLESPRLEKILFPLGMMTKDEVRKLARSHGLEVAEKPESQDFVAGGDYAPLFEGEIPAAGDIVDSVGNILGKHKGLPYYTIGQRRGIGISTGPTPLYVLSLDAHKNRVIVGPNSGLFSSGLKCGNFRFQDSCMAGGKVIGLAKIRQNHKPVSCSLTCSEQGVAVEFEIAQRAVAPGQSFVLYSRDGLVLGGGIIDEAIPAE